MSDVDEHEPYHPEEDIQDGSSISMDAVNTVNTADTTNTTDTTITTDYQKAHKSSRKEYGHKKHKSRGRSTKQTKRIVVAEDDGTTSNDSVHSGDSIVRDSGNNSNDSVGGSHSNNSNNSTISTKSSVYSLWLSKNQGNESRMQLLDSERVMLNNWLKKTQIYRKATYRANIYYKQWDTFLGVVPIILNAIIILMKGYEFIYTDEKIITIANFAMLAVSTIFSAVHSFLKLSKQGESMRNVSDKLMQVYLQIQIYLAQSAEPLIPPVKFIEIVYKDIVSLMEESGNVPISIMSRYQTRLQELDAANSELSQ